MLVFLIVDFDNQLYKTINIINKQTGWWNDRNRNHIVLGKLICRYNTLLDT